LHLEQSDVVVQVWQPDLHRTTTSFGVSTTSFGVITTSFTFTADLPAYSLSYSNCAAASSAA
jgi:hypothetical protein